MAKSIVVILAGGFEESEAIIPVDFLRRCELDVELSGLGGIDITGGHGIVIKADTIFDMERSLPDVVVLPGGSPGAENLAASMELREFLSRMSDAGKIIAAICASPALVLGPAGLLKGKRATCYPGLEKNFSTDVKNVKDVVVQDKGIITARGPGAAFAFASKIAENLVGEEKARAVSNMMLV